MSESKVGAVWSQAKHIEGTTKSSTATAQSAPRSKADRAAKIIFIPGHWHTPYHVQPLAKLMQQRGIALTAYQLESVGLKDVRPTYAREVKAILDPIMREIDSGEDVVLVCHSYAGMAGAEAVNQVQERLGGADMPEGGKNGKGRFRRLVLVASYVFPAGFVVDNKMFIGPEDPWFRITDEGMNLMLQPYEAFYNDMSKEDAQPFLENLAPVYYMPPPNAPCISTENWRKVPLLYVQCEKDAAMPLERQATISKGMETTKLNTGHDPFISSTKLVADILEQVAWEA